jgi:plastocyanin
MLLRPALLALATLAASAPGALAADATVEVPGKQFVPAEVTATVGDTVTWRFADGGHNAYGITPGLGTMPEGSTWSQRFDRPGTYAYACTQHEEMEGRVVVRDAPVPAPAPAESQPPAPVTEPLAAPPQEPAAAVAAPAGPEPLLRLVGVRANHVRLWVGKPARLVVRHVRAGGPRRVRTRLVHARPGSLGLRLDRWMGAGRHRLTILAQDAAGRQSAPVRLRVRVT